MSSSSRGVAPTSPSSNPLHSVFDSYLGPHASYAELQLQILPSFIVSLVLLYRAVHYALLTSVLQYIIFFALSYDIMGGLLTNVTSSCKQWYHRPGRSDLDLFLFSLAHCIHILIVALLYRPMDITFFLQSSMLLLLSSTLIIFTPLYLKNAVSFLAVIIAVMLDLYVWTPTKPLEWFVSLLFLKVCVGFHVPVMEHSYHAMIEQCTEQGSEKGQEGRHVEEGLTPRDQEEAGMLST